MARPPRTPPRDPPRCGGARRRARALLLGRTLMQIVTLTTDKGRQVSTRESRESPPPSQARTRAHARRSPTTNQAGRVGRVLFRATPSHPPYSLALSEGESRESQGRVAHSPERLSRNHFTDLDPKKGESGEFLGSVHMRSRTRVTRTSCAHAPSRTYAYAHARTMTSYALRSLAAASSVDTKTSPDSPDFRRNCPISLRESHQEESATLPRLSLDSPDSRLLQGFSRSTKL